MKRLAIIGAGGHGKVVADAAECAGWDQIDFFDDGDFTANKCNGPWPIVGNSSHLHDTLAYYHGVIVAIGHNKTRLDKIHQLIKLGAPLVTIKHPSATVSRYATVGLGSVIFAGVVINADAKIGIGAILNTCCSVDHDCLLGDGVHISPGANLAGTVKVGSLTWIGISASITQVVRIGNEVMVAAGAVVINDIPDNVTVFGVPARLKN